MTGISIVLCTYNRCEILRENLIAIGNQDLPSDVQVEVVVVDNNSTDATASVVQEIARDYRWKIQYVFEKEQGASAARNAGIKTAFFDLIALIDDDAIPESLWLAGLLEGFQKHNADAAGGRIYLRWAAEPPRWLFNEEIKKQCWPYLGYLEHGDAVKTAGQKDIGFLYSGNFAFKKSLVNIIGDFDTNIGVKGDNLMRGEDTDFLRRILENGSRVVYLPGAIVHHVIPQQKMTPKFFRKCVFNTSTALQQYVDRPRPINRWLVQECLGHLWAVLKGRLRGLPTEQIVLKELAFYYSWGLVVGAFERSVKNKQKNA